MRRASCRKLEFVTLVATIPAFYLAMLSSHRYVSAGLYLLAFAISGFVTWQEARPDSRTPTSTRAATRRQLHALLPVFLLLSALLPEGDRADLLILRLGTAALIVLRLGEAVLPSSLRGGFPHLLALGVGVLGLCGLGFWWLEPRAHSFGDGLWLAFTTAATVGYGDIVPSTGPSKIFAVFVVLLGVAVLSLLTASIAAVWVQTEERRIEHEILRDLHRELHLMRDELAAIRGGVQPARHLADTKAQVRGEHAGRAHGHMRPGP